MTRRLNLYPRWLRAWHWLNAVLFFLLILTGLSMHFSKIDRPVVPFDVATSIHNTAGIALIALYVIFLLSNVASGNRRHYVPARRGLIGDVLKQTRFYLLGIMRGEPHPFPATEERKYNPLQQLVYITVMVFLMPVLLATGVLLQVPDLAPDKFLGAGGIWPMAVAHSIAGFLLTAFTVVHIYLGTTGETATALYRTMITGRHEEHDDEGLRPSPDPLADSKEGS